ncbi:MAG TPA: hypothetical protein VE860_02435 [Chthoniobacterales bacterium]|nr:hypothetical protein [Chthoniobacterales bacterium]
MFATLQLFICKQIHCIARNTLSVPGTGISCQTKCRSLVAYHRELDHHLGPSSEFWINRKDRISAGIRNIPLGALFVVRRRSFGQRYLRGIFQSSALRPFGHQPLPRRTGEMGTRRVDGVQVLPWDALALQPLMTMNLFEQEQKKLHS